MAIMFVVLKLWHANMRIPLNYANAGDGVFAFVQAKQMLDAGWIYSDRWLAAPFSGTYYDFPTLSLIHLLAQKLLITLTHAPALSLNIYYLASYPLCALSALYALRRIGLSSSVSLPCGLLYAFIPGHLLRNEGHLYYSLYFFVPLACLVCLWIAQGEKLWRRAGRWPIPNRDGWIAIATMLAIGSDNQYHAFFTMVFLVVAALIGSARLRRPSTLIAAFVLLVCVGLSFSAGVLPSLAYERGKGANPTAFTRYPEEAEIYGLTVSQLVLPIPAHRVAALAAKRAFYDKAFPLLVNENGFVSLGAVGTLGFMLLLGTFILRAGRPIPIHLETLAILNGAGLLLSTVGGFGALFNYYIWPGFRAYNRISPFIAFFALAALAIALRSLRVHVLPQNSSARFALGMVALTVIGLWDQTSPTFVPPYAADAAVYASDAKFVKRVESALPPDSAIFELPYVPFPESPRLVDLDPARQSTPYLHSNRLRWSAMAIKGRPAARWQERVANMQPQEFLQTIVLSGFNGVVVFRDAYPDRGAALERQLDLITNSRELQSDDDALAFFSLADLRARVAKIAPSLLAPQNTARWRDLVATNAAYGDGFSIEEQAAGLRWRWSDRTSHIVVTNTGNTPVTFRFGAVVDPAVARPATLVIRAFGHSTKYRLAATGTKIDITSTVNPGVAQIDFSTDAPRLEVAGDPRPFYFRLVRPQITIDVGTIPANVAAVFDPQRSNRRSAILNAPRLATAAGCYPLEHGPTGTWRWCSAQGEFAFANPGIARDVSLEFASTAPGSPASHLVLTGPGMRKKFSLSPKEANFTVRLRLATGRTVVRFASDSAALKAGADPRSLVLRLDRLSVTP